MCVDAVSLPAVSRYGNILIYCYRALHYNIDISSYRGINKATILYLGPTNRHCDTEISKIPNIGIVKEQSITE